MLIEYRFSYTHDRKDKGRGRLEPIRTLQKINIPLMVRAENLFQQSRQLINVPKILPKNET